MGLGAGTHVGMGLGAGTHVGMGLGQVHMLVYLKASFLNNCVIKLCIPLIVSEPHTSMSDGSYVHPSVHVTYHILFLLNCLLIASNPTFTYRTHIVIVYIQYNI